jgi:hypothetical protein
MYAVYVMMEVIGGKGVGWEKQSWVVMVKMRRILVE